ncbi:MAG TPA: hypothetical protein PK156_22400 [Polyangium sp.]|nr:hypothetical protein [Polyangium sp.]
MKSPRMSHCLKYLGVVLWLAPSLAYAAPSTADQANAKKLYEQAAASMEREDYARACPLFENALQLTPQHVRTAISLGTCEERWGKMLSALRRFDYARSLAQDQSADNKVVEIDGLVSSLKHRLPRLRIIAPERFAAISDMVVERNGMVVPASDFGKAIAVDPGTYTISASSPRTGFWKTGVQTKLGHIAEITLGETTEPTYRNNSAQDESDHGDDSSSRTTTKSFGAQRTLGVIGMGVGSAGLVVGGILGGLAISKNSASDNGHCDTESYCDATGFALRQQAQQYANGSTGAFIVAGVLLTGGIVLVATAPSTNPKGSQGATAHLWIGPSSVGVSGRW